MTAIEEEQLKRYRREALTIAVELLKAWQTPNEKRKLISDLEMKAALDTAKGIFALWKEVPPEVEHLLRDFKIYMNEIKRIEEGRYGTED